MKTIFQRLTSQAPLLAQVFDEQYTPGPTSKRKWSVSTKKNYAKSLRVFDRFLDRPARLSDFNEKTFRKFLDWRSATSGRSTVHHDAVNLLAFWRWAADQGLVDRVGPDLHWDKLDVRDPQPLNETEADQVWQAIQAYDREVLTNYGKRKKHTGVPGAVWWSAMFLLCRDTDRRVEQVAMIKQADISPIGKWVRFPDENLSRRSITNGAAQAVDQLLGLYPFRKPNYRVFRRADNIASVWRDLKRIVVAAGLPGETELIFEPVRCRHE